MERVLTLGGFPRCSKNQDPQDGSNCNGQQKPPEPRSGSHSLTVPNSGTVPVLTQTHQHLVSFLYMRKRRNQQLNENREVNSHVAKFLFLHFISRCAQTEVPVLVISNLASFFFLFSMEIFSRGTWRPVTLAPWILALLSFTLKRITRNHNKNRKYRNGEKFRSIQQVPHFPFLLRHVATTKAVCVTRREFDWTHLCPGVTYFARDKLGMPISYQQVVMKVSCPYLYESSNIANANLLSQKWPCLPLVHPCGFSQTKSFGSGQLPVKNLKKRWTDQNLQFTILFAFTKPFFLTRGLSQKEEDMVRIDDVSRSYGRGIHVFSVGERFQWFDFVVVDSRLTAQQSRCMYLP